MKWTRQEKARLDSCRTAHLAPLLGRGFDASNLRNMRLFYQLFRNCDALRHELSWTHYRLHETHEMTRKKDRSWLTTYGHLSSLITELI
jgi:hypothetical protein